MGRVGSGRVGSGRVGSGRVGSGRVGSGRVGSGRVGSGGVGSGRSHPPEPPTRTRLSNDQDERLFQTFKKGIGKFMHEDLDDVAITDPDGGFESCNLFCSAVARKTDKLNQLSHLQFRLQIL